MQRPNLVNFDILKFSSRHLTKRLDSTNYKDANTNKISGIIVHCIGLPLQEVFKVFDKLKVSSHYLIPQVTGLELQVLMPLEFGAQTLLYPNNLPIIQLVDDDDIAHHAGVSCFMGKENLNLCTIGIEFHTLGYGDNNNNFYQFTPYSENQKILGTNFISYLINKYELPKINILGHSTISVGRKTDPGPFFFWKHLYENGLGYIPISKPLRDKVYSIKWIQEKLLNIGFSKCPQTGEFDELTQKHIQAYIMQFAPELWVNECTQNLQALAESLNGFEACINL